MSSPDEGSTFRNVFYAIGYALGETEARRAGGATPPGPAEPVPAGAEAEAGTHAAEPSPAPRSGAPGAPGPAAGAALGAATAWLLSRLLRPRRVHWPRALLAGLAGTLLVELADGIERRLGIVPADAPRPDGPLRLAAGLAAAAAYASVLYPRLPGDPRTRALIFAALEAAATRSGGTFAVLRRLSPQIAIPAEALAPAVAPARGPLSAVAFGLGLVLYRDGA
ncbi:MAG TPA: hypothetical protein VF158_11085 [Longimicrobiales bacterium]